MNKKKNKKNNDSDKNIWIYYESNFLGREL